MESRGKVLPIDTNGIPSAATVMPDPKPTSASPKADERRNGLLKVPMDTPHWRLRDTVDDLLAERPREEYSSNKMYLSARFDTSPGTLVSASRQQIARRAFDIAAKVVVKALTNNSNAMHTDKPATEVSAEERAALPAELQTLYTLQDRRTQALQRAQDKKTATKASSSSTTKVIAKANPHKATAAPDKVTSGPKFTRNTPASSAAALDSRVQSSRAILCAAANVAWGRKDTRESLPTTMTDNWESVVTEAQLLGKRTLQIVQSARSRSEKRYAYRRQNVQQKWDRDYWWQLMMESENDDWPEEDEMIVYQPNLDARTKTWTEKSLPRWMEVMKRDFHCIYQDVQWASRHGRLANALHEMAKEGNYGPHLILTTEPQVDLFAREFQDWTLASFASDGDAPSEQEPLRAMNYRGKGRRFWNFASGLANSPIHVVVSSYSQFFQDYVHFCQIPWECAILDEGVGWMTIAQIDSNGSIGTLWDKALWNTFDHQVGMVGMESWDFEKERMEEAWIGLTARHRILTNGIAHATLPLPISGLTDFLAPTFTAVVKEEWDRSRISSDTVSMNHFRRLVSQSVVVHASDRPLSSLDDLADEMLEGKLLPQGREGEPEVPEVFSDEEFVRQEKIVTSRRNNISWFGSRERSWMRYEFGKADLRSLLDKAKTSRHFGSICEEIITASSTTTAGLTGQVAGSMAYRFAIRCGRSFGSDGGLRLHTNALHAIPNTWLCRACGADCITSQSRTHHERSCGQSTTGPGDNGKKPTSSQGSAGTGKKKGPPKNRQKTPTASTTEKDADGSFRVAGYRGVWQTKDGRFIVKLLDGTRFEENGGTAYFDSNDKAAKKYDELLRASQKENQKVEFNFKEDGSRIVYEKSNASTPSGIGGSAASVVPKLAVINIKDLPPHVKPLLRDPRQTSRTGGNSKRHIYAYRGVCRQSRKGHDRWQSQISFMGFNHYLGTFDSEWDAAAVYAWAHLILYGEEATKQAQLEGEQAAAAYEQEKKDIAEGKIVEPPKPEKKKPQKKSDKASVGSASKKQSKPAKSTDGTTAKETKGDGTPSAKPAEKASPDTKKRKVTKKDKPVEKKPRMSSVKSSEGLGSVLSKSVAKATIICQRDKFTNKTDTDLMAIVVDRIRSARERSYDVADILNAPIATEEHWRPCFGSNGAAVGGAMLFGLSPSVHAEWDLQDFLEANPIQSEQDSMTVIQMLAVEYDSDGGLNERFSSIIQGHIAVLGNASRERLRIHQSMGLGPVPLGGSVGRLDCHLGGVPGSCAEFAADIRCRDSAFYLSCLDDESTVTVNGIVVTKENREVELHHNDICTVGARVFAFLLPL